MRRLLALVLIAGALLAGGPPSAFSTGGQEVHFVAVSLGDAIYLRAPSGADMVIDGGNNRDELADYLLSIGETEIDIVVARPLPIGAGRIHRRRALMLRGKASTGE